MQSIDYQEAPTDSLKPPKLSGLKANNEDSYYQSEKRKWPEGSEPGHLTNGKIIISIYMILI